jgi:hypothetical protein
MLLTSSPSPDRANASIARCHPLKHARCGPICANVDGIARRRKRLLGVRCRIENCVQPFTAVNLEGPSPCAVASFPDVIGAAAGD